jgi:hypothetical protein
VNRPDLTPDRTAVMGPPVPERRPVPGNDIGHPADVPKAASQSGSRYAIQTHDPRRAAAGSVPLNLDTTLVNVALPALVRELHATTTQLLWVVDSFNLVFAALLLTFGSLSDRFGRKGMLLAGLAVFGGASLAGGFTTDPAQLIAARSVMGLGRRDGIPGDALADLQRLHGEKGTGPRHRLVGRGRRAQPPPERLRVEGPVAGLLLEGIVLRLQADLRWLEACERKWAGRRSES